MLKDGWVELWGIAEHDNASQPPGVRSEAWTGKVYLYEGFPKIDDYTDVFVVVERSYRQGQGGISTFGLGSDFTIYGKAFGPFARAIGTLTGTCGISAGHRCGAIEFDLLLPFGK